MLVNYLFCYLRISVLARGAQLVEALRYSLKVEGSIPDGVIGIFQ